MAEYYKHTKQGYHGTFLLPCTTTLSCHVRNRPIPHHSNPGSCWGTKPAEDNDTGGGNSLHLPPVLLE